MRRLFHRAAGNLVSLKVRVLRVKRQAGGVLILALIFRISATD